MTATNYLALLASPLVMVIIQAVIIRVFSYFGIRA